MVDTRDAVDDEVMFVDGHSHTNENSVPVFLWTMAVEGSPSWNIFRRRWKDAMVNWIVPVANAPTRCFCSSLHDIFGDAVFPTTVVPELVSAIRRSTGIHAGYP